MTITGHKMQGPSVSIFKYSQLREHGFRTNAPTGAFAALVGKMAGARVVCMDHGNVTLLDNPSFRTERTTYLYGYTWPLQMLLRTQWSCYWASQRLLARIAIRYTDQFLIAGDEVETACCEQLGVPLYRMIRYAYTLDANRFTPPDKVARAKMRAEELTSVSTDREERR